MAGEQKAQAQLRSIQRQISDMSEAQLAVLKKVYEESQILVPVDEGDLKESARFDKDKVEYGTDHAVHVEFGTVKMKAQPYLRPAVMNHLDELAKISAKEIQQEIKEAV